MWRLSSMMKTLRFSSEYLDSFCIRHLTPTGSGFRQSPPNRAPNRFRVRGIFSEAPLNFG